MDLMNLYSMAENTVQAVTDEKGFSYVWAVVFTGLSVVFLALVILILFVWIMGKIFSAIDKSKKKKSEASKAAAPAAKTPAKAPAQAAKAVVPQGDDDEIIAVISAAVAAMGEAEGKTYRLRSVRASGNRSSRSAWSMAGLQNDTMPF